LLEIAFSESEDEVELSEEADFGGDGFCTEILLYGLRVLRIGPLLSNLSKFAPSFVFRGSVKAQFSHGMALFLSFSS
jgi:hypothetical protein